MGIDKFLLAFVIFAIAGCASTGNSNRDSANAIDTGLELTLQVREADGAESYFEVHRDGTIGYGGGMKARLGSTTWTGPMTLDEIEQLKRLVMELRWSDEDPESTRQPPEQRYRVTINGPDGRNSFTVKGEHPRVRPVFEMLDRIALRRLEPELEKLPRPSIEQMQR